MQTLRILKAKRVGGLFCILFLISASLSLSACGALLDNKTSATTTPIPPTSQPIPTEAVPTAHPEADEQLTANVLPDASLYVWQFVAGGFEQPVDIQNAGDNSGRVFVVEKPGLIKIVVNGEVLSAPFLDIRDRVGSNASERGLLGLAFHPRYTENGAFFINYTNRNGDTVIARFTANANDVNRADSGSERILLSVPQPYSNHNGGGLAFSPVDSYLYIGLGDGGSGGDPLKNGQSLNSLLGKILRVDVNQGESYAIPQDNPFAQAGGLPEIWAYGLRNPWRFSFDQSTGDLFIADVGQNKWEEINFLPADSAFGQNLGWNYFEGNQPFEGVPSTAAFTFPISEYAHGPGCSVTGGVVSRGDALPDWQGVYIYGDYCSGQVFVLLRDSNDNWQNQEIFDTSFTISTFGLGGRGEIYLTDYGTGDIYQLIKK